MGEGSGQRSSRSQCQGEKAALEWLALWGGTGSASVLRHLGCSSAALGGCAGRLGCGELSEEPPEVVTP